MNKLSKLTKKSFVWSDSDLTEVIFPMISEYNFVKSGLIERLANYLVSKKAFSKQAVDEAIKEGTLLELAKKVGVVAEEVIQEAFATRGFGKWKANKPSTIARKGSDSPLIDTGQLRRSITSKVDKR